MAEPPPYDGYLPTTDEELEDILGPPDDDSPSTPQAAPVGIWADELLKNPDLLKPPEAVVDQLAWRGRFTLFAAREKSGKSTLLTVAAAAVTRGQAFFNDTRRPPGNVLWVGLEESPGDILRRLWHYEADPTRVYIVTHLATLDQLAAAAAQPEGFDFCVVDTLAALGHATGLVHDENDASQMTAACAPIVALAHAPGAAAWVVATHGTKAEGGGYRGSTAIGASADVIIDMEEVDQTTRRFKVRARWHIPHFQAMLDGKRYRVVSIGDAESGYSVQDGKLMAFLAKHPGASRRDATTEIGGRTQGVLSRIDFLLREGVLEDRGTPGKSRLHVKLAASNGVSQNGKHFVPETLRETPKDMGEEELDAFPEKCFPVLPPKGGSSTGGNENVERDHRPWSSP